MTFKKLQLHPKILKAINICGYDTPTQIQIKAIPAILDGKDILASAQTGTGKTAAYVLPLLHGLITQKYIGKPCILVLSPTRELAIQIAQVINKYAKFIRINVVNVVGGVPYQKQIKQLSRNVDIIIATPGRLLDLMENKQLNLSTIKTLVLDEADRMLDMGFIKPIKTISQAISLNRQTLLFSATAEDKLMSAVKNLLINPSRINISADKIDTKLIKQEVHRVHDIHQKKKFLENLLKDKGINKAIIFSATKRNVKRLATQLSIYGYSAGEIHGNLKQNARNKILAKFRAGKIKFLVATDVASRGIDIADISHVINYDLPKFSEDYVHRIGRTGRAGKIGTAISMVLPSEKRYLLNIERYIGKKLGIVKLTNPNHTNLQL